MMMVSHWNPQNSVFSFLFFFFTVHTCRNLWGCRGSSGGIRLFNTSLCWSVPFSFLAWKRPSFSDCSLLIEKVVLVCLQLYLFLSVYGKDKELLRAFNNSSILMSRWTIWASLPLAALIIYACFNIYTCLEACPKPKVVLHAGNGIHRTSGYGF